MHLKVADLERALTFCCGMLGIQLGWDRPQEQWPRAADGALAMPTCRLDLGCAGLAA